MLIDYRKSGSSAGFPAEITDGKRVSNGCFVRMAGRLYIKRSEYSYEDCETGSLVFDARGVGAPNADPVLVEYIGRAINQL